MRLYVFDKWKIIRYFLVLVLISFTFTVAGRITSDEYIKLLLDTTRDNFDEFYSLVDSISFGTNPGTKAATSPERKKALKHLEEVGNYIENNTTGCYVERVDFVAGKYAIVNGGPVVLTNDIEEVFEALGM